MADRLLTRADVLGADDLKRERVAVPEWGGDLFIRTLTGAERDEFDLLGWRAVEEAKARGEDPKFVTSRNVMARLVAFAACDETGKRLFSVEDVEALGAKSGAALERVYKAADRLNATTAAAVATLAGN